MKTLSRQELVKKLQSDVVGATFCTIHTKTDPKALKKHRDTKEPLPYKEVRKTSIVNGVINFIYENSVNNQRKREDNQEEFKSEERKWGVRLMNGDKITPVIHHKDKFYIEVKAEKSKDVKYYGDGVEVKLDPGFLPKKKESSKQEVDKPVIIRDFAVDSIDLITLKGETYRLV